MKISTRQFNVGRCRGLLVVCLMALLCLPTGVWADEGADEDDFEQVEEDEEADEADDEQEDREVQQPAARMYVLAADGLEGEVTELVISRINETIRDRMGSVGGVELLPTFEAMRGGASGEGAREAISEARQSYTSGIGLVTAGEYEEAAEVLQPAVDVLEGNVADLSNFDVLSDAMLNLAVAHYQNGYDLDARDYIRQYAYLEPEETLERDDYPDGLVELYEDEVRRINEAGTGTVHVDADRPGADVILNGESMGETPVTLEEVSFGEHYLVVRDGDWLWSDQIQVRGRGQEQNEEVQLQDVDEADDAEEALPSFYVDLRNTFRTGVFGADMNPYLEELAAQTGAEYIAWTLVEHDGTEYAVIPFVYRVDDGLMIQGEEVRFLQDLTNVLSRSNQVSDTLAAAVVHMSEEQAVDEVELVEEQEVVAEQEVSDEDVVVDETDDEMAMIEDESEGDIPVPDQAPDDSGIDAPMPDEPLEEESSNCKMYMGLGGTAAGVLAGTMFFLLRSGDPTGFDAEVEW